MDATFQKSNGESQNLEINCWCTPHLNVSILGLEIVTDIRTVELYSNIGGYLKTGRGTKLDTIENEYGNVERTLYYCCLKLDDTVNDLTLKVSAVSHYILT